VTGLAIRNLLIIFLHNPEAHASENIYSQT